MFRSGLVDRSVRAPASVLRGAPARKVKAAARRYMPESLGGRVTDTVTGISRDVKAAVTEGRSAMREREAELRQTSMRRQGPVPASRVAP